MILACLYDLLLVDSPYPQASFVANSDDSIQICSQPIFRVSRIKFFGRHFPKDVIFKVVRWYVVTNNPSCPLSLRKIEVMFAERGITVDHTTINYWVIAYAAKLEALHRKQEPAVSTSWRMDETYIKVKGRDSYLYRAVDKDGKTVDFRLFEKRDAKAAKAFFRKALRLHGQPKKVCIDKSGSNKVAPMSFNAKCKDEALKITIYQSKYLHNITGL